MAYPGETIPRIRRIRRPIAPRRNDKSAFASEAIFQEVLRILRPGGCLAIVDNNPGSAVIQNLPPALFVLMKSTEPWSDDYYTFDVEAALQRVGFEYKLTVASDPRHRTLIAFKPN